MESLKSAEPFRYNIQQIMKKESQADPNYMFLPNFSPYFPFSQQQSLVHQRKIQDEYKKQVEELSHQISEVQQQISQTKKRLTEIEHQKLCRRCKKMNMKQEQGQGEYFKELPARRVLKKHLLCPFEGCVKRYSSTAALRLHLRKQHPKQEHQNQHDMIQH